MKKIFRLVLKTLLFTIILGTVALTVLWFRGSKEREDASSLIVNDISFSPLEDGTYYGYYEGGIYGYRENAVEVTIQNGLIIKIENILNVENKDDDFLNNIYDEVIENQSLEIDANSGATLTTKAYLKSIENAYNDAGDN